MATVYSGVVSGSYWRAYITYSTSSNLSKYSVTISSAGVNVPNSGSWVQYPFSATLAATGQTSVTDSISSTTITGPASKAIISSKTFTWDRSTTDDYTRNITLTIKNTYNGTSAKVSFSVTIPQRTKSTITYAANGGSGTMAATTYYNATSGTTTLRKNAFTRTGYSFVGWHKTKSEASKGNKEYSDGQSWNLKNTGNYTLYAAWKPHTLTIKYYKGTATTVGEGYDKSPMYTQTRDYGETLDLVNHSTFGITRTNYHRVDGKEWYQTVSGNTTYYDQDVDYALSKFADIKTTNKTVSLYPYFEEDTFTITFNANGGSGAPSAQTKYATKTLTLSKTIPTRTNYKFLGWSTNSAATKPEHVEYAAGASFTDNNNTTLYAVWELNTVNVTTYRYSSSNSSYSKNNYTTVSVPVTMGASEEVQLDDITNYFGFIGWLETKPDDVYPYSVKSIGTKTLFGNATKTYWAAYNDISPSLYKSINIDFIRVADGSLFNDYIAAINNNNVFNATTTDTNLLFGYIEFPAGYETSKITGRQVTVITDGNSEVLGLEYDYSTSYNKLFFSIKGHNDSDNNSCFKATKVYTILFEGNDDQGKGINETFVLKKRTVLVDIKPNSNNARGSINLELNSVIINRQIQSEKPNGYFTGVYTNAVKGLADGYHYRLGFGVGSGTDPNRGIFDVGSDAGYNGIGDWILRVDHGGTMHLKGNGVRIYHYTTPDSVYTGFSYDGTVSLPGNLNVAGNITINNHASEIGATSYTSESDVTVKNETDTNICNHTFTTGTWVIRCYLSFPANSSGDRVGHLSTTSASSSGYRNRLRAANGITRFNWTEILDVTSATAQRYLVAWQNSGSNLSGVAGRMDWVRIR